MESEVLVCLCCVLQQRVQVRRECLRDVHRPRMLQETGNLALRFLLSTSSFQFSNFFSNRATTAKNQKPGVSKLLHNTHTHSQGGSSLNKVQAKGQPDSSRSPATHVTRSPPPNLQPTTTTNPTEIAFAFHARVSVMLPFALGLCNQHAQGCCCCCCCPLSLLAPLQPACCNSSSGCCVTAAPSR